MRFAVLSRYEVEEFDCDEPYILISITCPKDTEPILRDSKTRLDVLKMRFHDWDIKAKELFDTKYPEDGKKMVFFSEAHAQEIVKFVNQYFNKVDLIVVNCAAGISRSAGVAAALSKCLTGEDAYFFERYIPNSLVYSTIIKEWQNEETNRKG